MQQARAKLFEGQNSDFEYSGKTAHLKFGKGEDDSDSEFSKLMGAGERSAILSYDGSKYLIAKAEEPS